MKNKLTQRLIEQFISVHHSHKLSTPNWTWEDSVRTLLPEITKELKQERDMPMGVSQWRNYGKKYRYWEFWKEELKQELLEEIERGIWKGAEKWAKMMVKDGELKIGDDKVVDGETIYGWTGEDEIVSSIVGYIKKELGIPPYHKLKR